MYIRENKLTEGEALPQLPRAGVESLWMKIPVDAALGDMGESLAWQCWEWMDSMTSRVFANLNYLIL